MSRRLKAILAVGGILIALFALLYSVSRVLLLNSYEQLEEDNTRLNVERVLNALDNEIKTLSVIVSDWAAWDDTYAFVEDGNEAYIDSNLGDETFYALDLNLALIINPSGEIIFGKTLYLDDRASRLDLPGLERYLTDEGLLLHHEEPTSRISGVLRLPSETLLIAANSILTSADNGPIRGTLIFGRLLTDGWFEAVGRSTRVTLTGARWDDPGLSPDMRAFKAAYAGPSARDVHPLDGETVAGYAAVVDVFGDPALILRAELPRDIYRQAHNTLSYLRSLLLVIGAMFAVVALALVEKIILAKGRFEVILNNSSDAISLARPDGSIELSNPAFNRIFGAPSRNGKQPSLQELVEAGSVAPLMVALNATARGRRHTRLTVSACDRHGHSFHADVALSAILGTNNHTSGIVCSVRDITAQKNLEQKLRTMLVREMEVSEMKAQFVSVTSHELRTPLTEIQLASESLERYGDRLTEGEKRQKITQIRAGIRHMTDLVENVLTIGRMESGKFSFRSVRFDVESFCRDRLRKCHTACGQTHETQFSSSGSLENACLDQKLLGHILDNLLSNAFKYSEPGSTVSLSVTGEAEQVRFIVRDEGIGVPEREQSRLFDIFFRSERVSDIHGTGLGLAIVKQAVDVHGGTIALTSAEGVGSTFVVTLPYVPESETDEENPAH